MLPILFLYFQNSHSHHQISNVFHVNTRYKIFIPFSVNYRSGCFIPLWFDWEIFVQTIIISRDTTFK